MAMIRTTIGFGAALVLVGVIAYAITAFASVTALIPALLGGVVLALGLLGRAKPGFSRFAVPAALAIAVLGVLGSFRGLGAFVALLGGQAVERPVAAVAQTLTLVLCLGYVILIARSWTASRSIV